MPAGNWSDDSKGPTFEDVVGGLPERLFRTWVGAGQTQ
jgi:hypothetical protein